MEEPLAGARGYDPWTECMRRGDFAGAWRISDAVLAERRGVPCSHWPRHYQYLWNGEPLDGKRVLVRCYHGLGDTVQFVRYAPRVKRIAREVILWAQPELLPLLSSAPGIDRLLPLHDGTPDVDYDVDVEVMELAHVFRSTEETLPRDVPYLFPRRAGDAATATPGQRLRVGIVWAAGGWDARRSVPLAELRPLFEVEGVAWRVLQRGPARQEWPGQVGLLAGSERAEELAAEMAALDLVVTVDSFPAHLAGALGVRTWTLLHAEPDWRWLTRRADSPWYPTMRLWRQEAAGEWGPVVQRVASGLRDLAERAAAGGGLAARRRSEEAA